MSEKNEPGDFHHRKEISFTWQLNSGQFHLDDNLFAQALGITVSISSINDFLSIFPGKDKQLVSEMFKQVNDGHDPKPIRACIVTRKSNVSLAQISAKKITENLVAGAVIPMFLTHTIEDFASFFHQIFENDHRGIIVTDEMTRIVACNSYFERSTGYRLDELLGKKTSTFNAGKHGETYFSEMWDKLSQTGFWNGLILSKGKSGVIKPQELLIQRLASTRGKMYYLGLTQDLSDKLYRVAGIEHGGIELLTQLPGEDEFYSRVKDELSEIKDEQGMLVLSFVPDFDDDSEFEQKKQLASALAYYENGYSAGFIKKAIFTISIVYSRSKDKPHSLSIFETIKERFSKIKSRVDVDVYRKVMNCTIGVSVLGLDANSGSKLISHSLQAMYEKHTSNNNNICFFSRALHQKLRRREELEDIIRQSVEDEAMEVYFQPIISSTLWKVRKLEALCRFRDNDGELLNTEEMIKVAEDMELVSDLDLAIADKAIRYRDELVAKFGEHVEITINVSINSQKPIKLIFSDLMALFEKHQRHLPYINVELTESAYFNSEPTGCDLLYELHKKGIKVVIDDFGTGYSSFSYLKDNHFDLLKIDKNFITDLTVGSHNYYIIKMITNLAHILNVEVVAEGVETLQEVTILKDLKVDFMQGFYFEKPLPVNLLSRNINFKDEIRELTGLTDENVELFVYPPVMSPTNTLRELKEVFDNRHFHTLPVVLDKDCVGVVTREQFNLHATPTMGTDRETMQEFRALDKIASAVMTSSVTRVHETINAGEIYEKIRNRNALPWVVINDAGHYVAIIDTTSMIHYLNEQ
ncbi:EAL domain-containing protein [Vibrio salinus]|uniref:EAL domain-containing protein n=1 Tax=Vibrio salinus TaxID=2899784 RepID=UPI001E4B550C|nr:EAL domain-containing protein [Vibrio salinus]MCE0494785.1 EAL domain-containing protein [Vibrio salinus]